MDSGRLRAADGMRTGSATTDASPPIAAGGEPATDAVAGRISVEKAKGSALSGSNTAFASLISYL